MRSYNVVFRNKFGLTDVYRVTATSEADAVAKAEKKLGRTALQAIFSPAGSLLGQAVRLEC